MSRSYDRESMMWDINDLRELAALDPPQAVFFEKADRWVVKFDGRSFAVKPKQITDRHQDSVIEDDNAAEAALADAEIAQAEAETETLYREQEARTGVYVTANSPDAEIDDLVNYFTKGN